MQNLNEMSNVKDEARKISFYIKVGGIAGIGSSKVYATFTIPKSRFSAGDQVDIKVDMDNRASSKDVKKYKFKLWRHWKIYSANNENGKGKKLIKQGMKYVTTYKSDLNCCKAKQIEKDRICSFTLPTQDNKDGIIRKLSRTETPCYLEATQGLRNALTWSTQEFYEGKENSPGIHKVFKIEYALHVFVKHDSWSSFGVGKH
jgi:hypothetical protein